MILEIANYIFLLFNGLIALWLWRQHKINQFEKKMNATLKEATKILVSEAQTAVQRNEKLVAEAKRQVSHVITQMESEYYGTPKTTKNNKFDLLNDPGLLSSMITALVMKYGEMRLSMNDFADVTTDDYVTVYVEALTKEVVFSSKHKLADDDKEFFANYATRAEEDETYH